jgi:restriction endonuclease Mrr
MIPDGPRGGRNGLGVSTMNTYAVKRVDNDFFDEDEA